jgi:hypothetical protein
MRSPVGAAAGCDLLGHAAFPLIPYLPTSAVHPAVDNLSTYRCNPSVMRLCGLCSIFVQSAIKRIKFKQKQTVTEIYHL